MEQINLRKQLVFNLSKERGLESQKAQVVVCMDISGSMDHMYESGFVQRLLDRLLPVAMQFDDNEEMELYLFQNNSKRHPRNISLKNIDGIVNREIIGKYSMGGTNYAPSMEMIKKDYIPTPGFFSRKADTKLKYPVYVIFITDGNNDDKSETEVMLQALSKFGIFFQFVGIGNARFSFLEKLDNLSGRFIDNANFFQANDLDWVSDNDLYSKLLGEFPEWVQLAKQHNLID